MPLEPSNNYTISPIGEVISPFKEKFGIPRQPKICTLISEIKLTGDANNLDCLAGIEQNSHIWVLFLFHQNLSQGWKPKVRPPRLGGNEKVGVFATRSSFRPNGIGMSAVKLLDVEQRHGECFVKVEGLDLVDGTPIIDIKPYVPYSDLLEDASSEIAPDAPDALITVNFTPELEPQLVSLERKYAGLTQLITQVLEQDPRPAYKKSKHDAKVYGIRLYDLNIRWRVTHNICQIISIEQES